MFSFLLVVQILVSVSIIALVMLQHGKGADMGAAFGSGSSGTVFGARGSGSFLTRATGILAAVFFINCVLIASPLLRNTERSVGGVADQLEQQVQQQQAAERRLPTGISRTYRLPKPLRRQRKPRPKLKRCWSCRTLKCQ